MYPHLAMHEQPNSKGDIESSFNHTGVHHCKQFVPLRLGHVSCDGPKEGHTHSGQCILYKNKHVMRDY